MSYKTKEMEFEGIYYDGTNADEVVALFPAMHVTNGKLYDNTVLVNDGVYIAALPGGTRKFTKSVFETIFEEVPEESYYLSEISISAGTKIRDVEWAENVYLEWTGFAWKFVTSEEEILYTIGPEDLHAKWIVI